ncbi:MAG: NTP transferase domain-containing protein [Gemmatimonadetes bacterium]|nr:NTP transferase domain-containing protein [Gemmatimonadota bacterium]
MRLTLAILAAGRSARFGRSKQLEPVGPSGEALFEYTVYDAIRAGCDRVILVTPPRDAELLRTAAEIRLGTSFQVEFLAQELEDVPAGFRPPGGRLKPWGTGHAVLALRDRVDGPFIVANSDDFYGPGVIERLAGRLKDARMTGDPSHFLAGYELQNTGIVADRGVNRGVCGVDASLILERLEEVTEIRAVNGDLLGVGIDGEERSLRPERLCSMNLWAFQTSIFEHLSAAFERFHARLRDPIESEFLLSEAVGTLVETGRSRVRVVPTGVAAVGLTHPDDVAAVESGVSLAVAVGDYPTDLGEWFEERKGGIPR